MFQHQVGSRLALNDVDLDALNVIARHGPLSPSSLARRAGLPPATITGVLDRLERGDWISRERIPTDRRAVLVRLKRDRTGEMNRAFAGMNTSVRDLCARYQDLELELIVDFLSRLTTASRTAASRLATA